MITSLRLWNEESPLPVGENRGEGSVLSYALESVIGERRVPGGSPWRRYGDGTKPPGG